MKRLEQKIHRLDPEELEERGLSETRARLRKQETRQEEPAEAKDNALLEVRSELVTVGRNQLLMIDRLQQLHAEIEEHDARSATTEDVVAHDERVRLQMQRDRERVEAVVRELHQQLQKASLRSRLNMYAGVSVLVCTILTVLSLTLGQIVISPPFPAVLLLASILFWLMARRVPPIEEFPEVFSDDR